MRDEEERGMATIERRKGLGCPQHEEIPEISGIPLVVNDGTVVANAGNDQWAEVSFRGFAVSVTQRESDKEGIDRCVVKYCEGSSIDFANVQFPQGYIWARTGNFSFGKTREYPRKLFRESGHNDRKNPHTTILVVDDDALVMHADGDIELCHHIGEDAHPYLAPSENVMVAAGAHSFTVLPGKVRHHYAPSLG